MLKIFWNNMFMVNLRFKIVGIFEILKDEEIVVWNFN